MKQICLLSLSVFLLFGATVSAKTLITWAPWEIDSTVTAWYLKRYVLQDVEYKSVPKGTLTESELSLDQPNSPYRRSAKQTTLDSAIDRHKYTNKCIKELVKVVRLLELMPWRKSTQADAEQFEYELMPLLPKQPVKGGLEFAFDYLDTYCLRE
jgi:hypothetical protein